MVSRFITKPVMMPKFRLFRRAKTFWCEDAKSGRQQSLGTKNKGDATCLLHGRNEAHAVPFANLQIARAYLMAADSKAPTRTWGNVFEEIIKPKWWCRFSPPTNRNRRPTSAAKSVSRALCLRIPRSILPAPPSPSRHKTIRRVSLQSFRLGDIRQALANMCRRIVSLKHGWHPGF